MKLPKKTSIRLRSNGLYELRFYKDLKQISVYGKTKTECIEKYKNWKPKPKTKKDTSITFETLWKEFLFVFKKTTLKEKTIKNLNDTFNKNVIPYIGDKKIKSIKTIDIQNILNNLNDRLRQKTIIYVQLNACFNNAIKQKKLKNNPCEGCEIKKIKQIKKGIALTKNQQTILVNYLIENNHELKNLIFFYLLTGVRRNEALSLKYEDIDFINKQIHIRGTKTNKSNRIIDTTQEVLNLIPKKEIPFNYKENYVSDKFKKICESLNLTDIHIHSLRHTFATRCLENGIDIPTVQKWLGHSTYKLTADTYTHIQTEHIKNQIEKLKNYTLNLPLKKD